MGKKSPKTVVKKRAASKPGGRGHNSTYVGQTHIFGPKLSHAEYTKSQKDKKVHVAKSPGATTPKSREVKAAIIAELLIPKGKSIKAICSDHGVSRSFLHDLKKKLKERASPSSLKSSGRPLVYGEAHDSVLREMVKRHRDMNPPTIASAASIVAEMVKSGMEVIPTERWVQRR